MSETAQKQENPQSEPLDKDFFLDCMRSVVNSNPLIYNDFSAILLFFYQTAGFRCVRHNYNTLKREKSI